MSFPGIPEPRDVITRLFAGAKAKDEFEFCCALLRIRGMEGPGWDPTSESLQLIQQIVGLIQAPLDQALTIRLSLFLYAHIVEMSDFYCVPVNMLRILAGDRYSTDPLKELPKPPKPVAGDALGDEAVQLITLANTAGAADLARLYSAFYIRQVRNAFSHSDYALGANSFNIRRGERLNIDGVRQNAIPYEWLMPRLELGINTALALFRVMIESAQSYTSNKIVKGRFSADGSYADVELTTDPAQGLTGFRSPPRTFRG